MNLRALVNFVYIMNHIDKQVIFTIPLESTNNGPLSTELTFVQKILMGEIFRRAKFSSGETIRRAKFSSLFKKFVTFARQTFARYGIVGLNLSKSAKIDKNFQIKVFHSK